MGAHPDAPSVVVLNGSVVPLNELIDAAPADILHPRVAARFGGQLPFLFKVLAAAAPLSLQTHPNKRNAEAGFARENEAGIPLTAPQRNYKDRNHKPELLVALTDFYALRGFRPLPEIARQIESVPELCRIGAGFVPVAGALRKLYSKVMTLPQNEVNLLLNSLLERLTEADRDRPFGKAEREYWLLRADRKYSCFDRRDRGLFSFYLLNLVHLRAGEGMYLPAGILHAYLEGAGMEVMANSNNVLRGGLTTKHIDVPELLRNVIFEGAEVEIRTGQAVPGTQTWIYPTPAREFELSRIELSVRSWHTHRADHAAEILIVGANEPGKPVWVKSGNDIWTFERGQVFLIPSRGAYELTSSGASTLYKGNRAPGAWGGCGRGRRGSRPAFPVPKAGDFGVWHEWAQRFGSRCHRSGSIC